MESHKTLWSRRLHCNFLLFQITQKSLRTDVDAHHVLDFSRFNAIFLWHLWVLCIFQCAEPSVSGGRHALDLHKKKYKTRVSRRSSESEMRRKPVVRRKTIPPHQQQEPPNHWSRACAGRFNLNLFFFSFSRNGKREFLSFYDTISTLTHIRSQIPSS